MKWCSLKGNSTSWETSRGMMCSTSLRQSAVIPSLLQMVVEDPQMKSYIGKIRSALDKIRRQFQFAKDYQNLGTEPPQWQSLASVIRRAGDLVSLKGVTITDTCGNAAVFADPILEKAMVQLLDNAVRHGGNVSSVRISVHDVENGAVFVVEDNGTGVPAADKERIFERGFGKSTGWGLFLTREILALTGMTITETGDRAKVHGSRSIYLPRHTGKRVPKKRWLQIGCAPDGCSPLARPGDQR